MPLGYALHTKNFTYTNKFTYTFVFSRRHNKTSMPLGYALHTKNFAYTKKFTYTNKFTYNFFYIRPQRYWGTLARARTHTHTLYVCPSLCLGYQFGSVNVQRKKTKTHEKKTQVLCPVNILSCCTFYAL